MEIGENKLLTWPSPEVNPMTSELTHYICVPGYTLSFDNFYMLHCSIIVCTTCLDSNFASNSFDDMCIIHLKSS